MAKAKKVLTMYGKHANVVEYEYRGRTYYVEYANDWTYCTTPAKIQHEDAQSRIDKEIETEERQKNRKPNPVDWDEIWKILEWD